MKEKPIARLVARKRIARASLSTDMTFDFSDGWDIYKGDFVSVIRDNQVIVEKDQVRVLKDGSLFYKDRIRRNDEFDCVIILATFDAFQEGDIIEVIERTVKE